AGESTHISEVIELLAHSSVQSGDLARARDLYQKLTTVEPGNPLHMNNYQQVVSQLGGDTGTQIISAEEAAVIVDELEATAPSIAQHYSDAVALAVRSALTDAELFISYNMPAKALGPLMAALPQAPNDLRLNQRLAALHTRAARFAEAGVCCRTLQNIYSEAGYPEEATRYGELATRYEGRSAVDVVSSIPATAATPSQQAAEAIPEITATRQWTPIKLALSHEPAKRPTFRPRSIFLPNGTTLSPSRAMFRPRLRNSRPPQPLARMTPLRTRPSKIRKKSPKPSKRSASTSNMAWPNKLQRFLRSCKGLPTTNPSSPPFELKSRRRLSSIRQPKQKSRQWRAFPNLQSTTPQSSRPRNSRPKKKLPQPKRMHLRQPSLSPRNTKYKFPICPPPCITQRPLPRRRAERSTSSPAISTLPSATVFCRKRLRPSP